MENLEWIDKTNDIDDVDAKDINDLARYAQKLNKNKADNELAFDYYYETTSINPNDSDYQRVGIHKIKKTGSMEQPTIIMTQAYAGGLQQTIIRSNYIRLRQIKPDGTMTDWDDYVINSKLEEKVAEAKAYTDEKIGDIETALDTIIEMQNELTGGVEV